MKTKSKKKILYECDHRACEVCSNPNHLIELCNHTYNLKHAQNFKNEFGMFIENIRPRSE